MNGRFMSGWLRLIFLGFILASAIPLSFAFEDQLTSGGDANGDGIVDIADGVYLLQHLFMGGKAPVCSRAVNVNGDGRVDVSDGVYLLQWLFGGGSPPVFEDVSPLGCGIVGDMRGQALIDENGDPLLNDDGSPEVVGDHVKVEDKDIPEGAVSYKIIYCASRPYLQELFEKFIHISFDTSCSIPIVVPYSLDKKKYLLYKGCASDGKIDIIEYVSDVECRDSLDSELILDSYHSLEREHSIYSGKGNDLVMGSPYEDKIITGEGTDYVYGLAGDDYIEGRDGSDVIYGGSGTDTLYGRGQDEGGAEDAYNILSGNEGNDFLSGQGQDNALFGDGGNDEIYAHKPLIGRTPEGITIALGGDGDDTISGSDGNDFIFGGKGEKDEIYGGEGDDFIVGDTSLILSITKDTKFDDVLKQVKDSDIYKKVVENHEIFAESEGDFKDIIDAGSGNNVVFAEGGDDEVVGYWGDDWFFGGAGKDTLGGFGGDDVLYGGKGDDGNTLGENGLVGGEGNDVLCGGEGRDVVFDESGEDDFIAGPRDPKVKEFPEELCSSKSCTPNTDIKDFYWMNEFPSGNLDKTDCIGFGSQYCHFTKNDWHPLEPPVLPVGMFQEKEFYVKLPDCYFAIDIAENYPPSSDDGPPVPV